MNDTTTTLKVLKDKVHDFVSQREWQQFHSPKNLSMDIAIEAAELMEKFLWITTESSREEIARNRQEIADEAADVFMALLSFCNATGIDISTALEHKMISLGKKYPVEKARGSHLKYDKL